MTEIRLSDVKKAYGEVEVIHGVERILTPDEAPAIESGRRRGGRRRQG